MSMQKAWCGLIRTALFASILSAQASLAQDGPVPGAGTPSPTTLNFNGVTGLIDMPSGQSAPDGQFSWNTSTFAGQTRTALSFQITPRLSGSFRYTGLQNWNFGGFATYYDRSFDLRYKLVDEGRYLPSVTIGMQDFIGTGLFAGEYIAATKTISPRLRVTAGLGWGRLGSYNSVGSPFGDRARVVVGRGGKPNTDQWFRGPVAPFAGVEWQASDKLGLKLEYSSDAYRVESGQRGLFDRKSPWNFGAEYQVTPSLRFGAYYLYGTEVGLNLSIALDPKRRPQNAGIQGPAPLPVKPRPSRSAAPAAWSTDWVASPQLAQTLETVIGKGLELEGMKLEALSLQGDRVQVRFRNNRFDAEAQAMGRVARLLTQVLPASVEIFELVPVFEGMPLSRVTFRRSDIERLESAPNGSALLRQRTTFSDPGPLPTGSRQPEDAYPSFVWSFLPYTELSFFDPSNPVRADYALRLSGRYSILPGLIFSGSLTKRLAGNIGDTTRLSNSILPHVRSDFVRYNRVEAVKIEKLTLAWYGHPATNIYSRFTVGYLEQMYGGVSTELLWKPVNSRLALGAELNYVAQRDFEQDLGFRNYRVLTGHASAYYTFPKGYEVELDVGRYLAGDLGATLTVDRAFDNGWRIGAFATLTDVPFEDFGEGSFDKGIRLTIPLAWISGQPSRKVFGTTIRPLTRDGGARLRVDGRLIGLVRSYHSDGLDQQWGRVFR